MYRFSINTQADLRVNSHYGYGKSLIEIKKSMRDMRLNGQKIVIEHNSSRSNVQMYYGPHPMHDSHFDHQYKIHMSQIESDMLEPHKVKAYSECNEFWTANEWGAKAAIKSGVPEEKVFVYPHGIFPEKYLSSMRGKSDKIRFLHIDSGSPRKRADIVEKAFDVLYEKNKDIELTLKYSHYPNSSIDWTNYDTLRSRGEWLRPGVRHIYETFSDEEMIALMKYHDVLVYPSEGEGFGLIPLEAMATGMPVISTHEWSSYADFFVEGHLSSSIKPSQIDWGYPKVGNGVIVDFDSVVEKMSEFIDNINECSAIYYKRSKYLKEKFDWKFVTETFFDGAFERFGDLLISKGK